MQQFQSSMRTISFIFYSILFCLTILSCGKDNGIVIIPASTTPAPAPTSSFAKALSTPTSTYGNRVFGSANGKYLVASGVGCGTSVSTDYGQTWTARPGMGTAFWLFSGYVSDDGTLWIGASHDNSPNIYRSSDGFATFSTVAAVTSGNVDYLWKPYGLSSTVFVASNSVPTVIYKSTDNGLTFSSFASNTNVAAAYSISGSDDATTMLITGADWGNNASFTTDSGVTWSKTGVLDMHGITGSTSSDGTKMFVPWGYSLTTAQVSTNHGATWSDTTGAAGLSWASGANADHSAIYEIEYNSNRLYKSIDYGLTFSLFETITAMSGAPFSGSKQNYGIFVSRNGKVVAIGGTDGIYIRYF